jgi:hypothetical protein
MQAHPRPVSRMARQARVNACWHSVKHAKCGCVTAAGQSTRQVASIANTSRDFGTKPNSAVNHCNKKDHAAPACKRHDLGVCFWMQFEARIHQAIMERMQVAWSTGRCQRLAAMATPVAFTDIQGRWDGIQKPITALIKVATQNLVLSFQHAVGGIRTETRFVYLARGMSRDVFFAGNAHGLGECVVKLQEGVYIKRGQDSCATECQHAKRPELIGTFVPPLAFGKVDISGAPYSFIIAKKKYIVLQAVAVIRTGSRSEQDGDELLVTMLDFGQMHWS